MSVYLDTQVVMWLAAGRLQKLSREATRSIDTSQLEVSPVVLVELQYLYEIGRIAKPGQAVFDQLQTQIGLKISHHPFPAVAHTALSETWTRDLFDRMIVAQARSDNYAPLVSSDEKIRQNYSRTIW